MIADQLRDLGLVEARRKACSIASFCLSNEKIKDQELLDKWIEYNQTFSKFENEMKSGISQIFKLRVLRQLLKHKDFNFMDQNKDNFTLNEQMRLRRKGEGKFELISGFVLSLIDCSDVEMVQIDPKSIVKEDGLDRIFNIGRPSNHSKVFQIREVDGFLLLSIYATREDAVRFFWNNRRFFVERTFLMSNAKVALGFHKNRKTKLQKLRQIAVEWNSSKVCYS